MRNGAVSIRVSGFVLFYKQSHELSIQHLVPEIICVQANAPTALGSCELKRNMVAVSAAHINTSSVGEGKFSLRLCA